MKPDVTHPFADGQEFVSKVIQKAFKIMSGYEPGRYGKVGDAWLNALREVFWEPYKPQSESGIPGQPRIAAFGGRPPAADRMETLPSGLRPWPRWEFMHDVTLMEVEWVKAAYRPSQVPVLKRALWQVESELKPDGMKVGEDLSKLKAGQADYKLLIVARTDQKDPAPWRNFIDQAATGISGETFVAEIPTYAGMTTKDFCELDKGEIHVRRLGPQQAAPPAGT